MKIYKLIELFSKVEPEDNILSQGGLRTTYKAGFEDCKKKVIRFLEIYEFEQYKFKDKLTENFKKMYPTTWSKMDTNMRMDLEFFFKKVLVEGL